MWAKSARFLFTARTVFLGETPETDSAICSHNSDLRRLLLHRLEVLEAALLHLVKLKAAQQRHEDHMQSFNSFLLLNTLCAIAEEIDPDNSALQQLRYAISQKAAELRAEAAPDNLSVQIPGAA